MEPAQKCLILQGIPAAGKSTWARTLVLADPTWKRVNRDDIRRMVHAGVWSPENEQLTREIQMSAILNALKLGYNVVIDDTNLSTKVVQHLRTQISQAFPAVGWKTIRFTIPLHEALQRNRTRPTEERVPDHVIRRMWMMFQSLPEQVF